MASMSKGKTKVGKAISKITSKVKNVATKVLAPKAGGTKVGNTIRDVASVVSKTPIGGSSIRGAATVAKAFSPTPAPKNKPMEFNVGDSLNGYKSNLPATPTSGVGRALANRGVNLATETTRVDDAGRDLARGVKSTVDSVGSQLAGIKNAYNNNNSVPGRTMASNQQASVGGVSQTTYNGAPAVETTSYGTPQASSAGYSGEEKPLPVVATAEERAGRKDFITTEEANRTTQQASVQQQKMDLENQVAAIQAQIAAVQGDEERMALETDLTEREQQMNALESELDRLSRPSAEVLAAQREEDALDAQEAGIGAELNQKITDVSDQPIPEGFHTGWGNTFNKQANAKIQTIAAQRIPLQQKLATFEAKRQAALDVVKTKLNRAQDRYRTTDDRLYDYKKEKRNREDEANQPYTLSEGQTRYDPRTGQIIKAPKTYKAGTSSSDTKKTQIATGSAKLEASRGSDGWVDPYVYRQAYQDWVNNNVGTAAEFISKFPPKNYANPAAGNILPAYLQNKESGGAIMSPF